MNEPDDSRLDELDRPAQISSTNRFRHRTGWHHGDINLCHESLIGIEGALKSIEVHIFAIHGAKVAKEAREQMDDIITDTVAGVRADLDEAGEDAS